MNLAAVVFDLDGTLVDSVADVTAAFREAWLEHGFDGPFPEARLRIGPPLDAVVRALAPAVDEVAQAALRETFRARYDGGGFARTVPYPGVIELLDELRAAGVAAYVGTNKREAPSLAIVSRCFGERVSRSLCLGATVDGAAMTSKAAMLRWVASCEGVDVARVAMVGDTPGDIAAAREAGAVAIAVTWGYGDTRALTAAAPDRAVSDVTALREALGLTSHGAAQGQ